MRKLSNKRCLLDTNVLLAFINKSHRYYPRARKLFERILLGEFKPVISSQNLLELSAVLVHGFKKDKKEAAYDIALFTSDPLLEIIYPNLGSLVRFFDLMKKGYSLHVVDLFLLATALENNIAVVISADKGFREIREIEAYNPFDQEG